MSERSMTTRGVSTFSLVLAFLAVNLLSGVRTQEEGGGGHLNSEEEGGENSDVSPTELASAESAVDSESEDEVSDTADDTEGETVVSKDSRYCNWDQPTMGPICNYSLTSQVGGWQGIAWPNQIFFQPI